LEHYIVFNVCYRTRDVLKLSSENFIRKQCCLLWWMFCFCNYFIY